MSGAGGPAAEVVLLLLLLLVLVASRDLQPECNRTPPQRSYILRARSKKEASDWVEILIKVRRNQRDDM